MQEQPAAYDAAALAHDLAEAAPASSHDADSAIGSDHSGGQSGSHAQAPLPSALPKHLNIPSVLARLTLPDEAALASGGAAEGGADMPQQPAQQLAQRQYELRRHIADSLADVLLCAPELLGGDADLIGSGASSGSGSSGGCGEADAAAGQLTGAQDAGSLDAQLVLFQLLSALAAVHGGGGTLGGLQPADVLLHDRQ